MTHKSTPIDCDAIRAQKAAGIILTTDQKMAICGCAKCVDRVRVSDMLWNMIDPKQPQAKG